MTILKALAKQVGLEVTGTQIDPPSSAAPVVTTKASTITVEPVEQPVARTTSHSSTPQEALDRAVNNSSTANYEEIVKGFMARGIPESEIHPRENVFTYNAWRAKGRQVSKGRKGVRITVYVPSYKDDPDAPGEQKLVGKYRRSASVFHVSQTIEVKSK